STGVRITDARSGALLTNGILDLRDNLWWSFGGSAAGAGAALLFNDGKRHNDVVNPHLAGISRVNDHGLDPRPLEISPALCVTRTPPANGFYSQVGYKGAFDADDLWLRGWTFLDQKGFLATSKATVPPGGTNEVIVTADIAASTVWSRGNVYLLDGFVYVLAGATLHIEAGTVIKGLGAPTTGESASALIVTRGGRVNATGTPNYPIIFTAEEDNVNDPDDLGIFQRGLWGGVVLLGAAPINTSATPAGNTANPKYDVFEGLPDAQIGGQFVHRYGGNDPNDSSGEMSYVSIRHCGFEFLPNRELNGLSLGGVGRGTVLHHIETYAVADDGFEFFGGTVDTKYLVSAFNDDDSFDTDQGWTGRNQFWFAIQEDGRRDNGGELNGEPNGLAVSNAPIANYEIYNATWIGAGATGANSGANHGLTIREYAAPRIYNSIITDYRSTGVRITDARSGALLTNGILDLRDNLWWSFGGSAAGAGAALLFEDATRNNQVADPMLNSISRTNDHRLDPRVRPGSPALAADRLPPLNGFFTPVGYKGAFDASDLWLRGWTFLDQKGFLPAATPVCPQPDLTITVDGGNVRIAWEGTAGCSYQVESRADLATGMWAPEGNAVQGTGTLTYTTSLGGGKKFFRVRAQ
ncbi:MAG TPA: hypothetical protein VNO52_09590, partial [Methylomirabilota bacterium]|nr:hypothetical protein [Methylomirabilota bacterium]